jgi:hypothetical protein
MLLAYEPYLQACCALLQLVDLLGQRLILPARVGQQLLQLSAAAALLLLLSCGQGQLVP